MVNFHCAVQLAQNNERLQNMYCFYVHERMQYHKKKMCLSPQTLILVAGRRFQPETKFKIMNCCMIYYVHYVCTYLYGARVCAVWTAELIHKVGDDSMEVQPIVELGRNQV